MRLVQVLGARCERCGDIEASEFKGPWRYFDDGTWKVSASGWEELFVYPLIFTEEFARSEMVHGCALPPPRITLLDPQVVDAD